MFSTMLRLALLAALVPVVFGVTGCDDYHAAPNVGAYYSGPLPRHRDATLGALTGTVVAPAGSAPTGTLVLATEEGGLHRTLRTRADASGDYLFTRVPEGTWRIGFAGAGVRTVTTDGDGALRASVVAGNLTKAGTCFLQAGSGATCRIEGQLVGASGSTVRIEVVGLDASLATTRIDASGRFSVAVPAAGEGRLRRVSLAFVSPAHYLAVVQGVELAEGATVRLPAPVTLRPVVVAAAD